MRGEILALSLISIYKTANRFCNEKKSLRSNSCLTTVLYRSMKEEKLTRFVLEGKIDIAAVVNPHYKCMELLLSTHSAFPLPSYLPFGLEATEWKRKLRGKGRVGRMLFKKGGSVRELA